MIRSADDRMGADGWIACGCGMIGSVSDVVDASVVNGGPCKIYYV